MHYLKRVVKVKQICSLLAGLSLAFLTVSARADDAVFFGTSSPVLRDTHALVHEYFEGFANLGDISMAVGDHRVQVFDNVAVSTGYYTMTTNDNGELTDSNARFTFVYAKRNGGWIIVEHHSSSVP